MFREPVDFFGVVNDFEGLHSNASLHNPNIVHNYQ